MKPKTNTHIAFLSIGSNLGSRRLNCLRAISDLAGSGRCEPLKQSAFYETEPVGYEDQGWFVNAAVQIKTALDPTELLKELKNIEAAAGRNFKETRFGPRVLDLDIIFYDNLILESPNLIIPHPRMHRRRFVLQPLCDIMPKMVHPVLKKTVKELLAFLEDADQRIFKYK